MIFYLKGEGKWSRESDFLVFWIVLGGGGRKGLEFCGLGWVLTEAEVDFGAIGAWEPCDLGEMRAEEGLQMRELCGFGFGQEMDFTEEGFDARSGRGLQSKEDFELHSFDIELYQVDGSDFLLFDILIE